MYKKILSVILVVAMMLSVTAVPVEVSACSGEKHTVKFYDGKILLKSQTVTCGKAATAPKNPSKSGYTFIGWDKLFNNVTKNITVNAVFKENIKSYTVKFYNGSKLIKTQTVKSGKAATAPKNPTKSGYTFIGWDRPFNKVTKDITVNAVFKQNVKSYTVSFNTGGGSKVASQTVKTGTSVKKPADPTRKGYVFAGWYSDSVLKTFYDFSATVTKNLTLYAKWEKDSGNSNTNGGNKAFNDVFMTIQDITPGSLSYFFTNTSDKEYEFGEWYMLYVFRNNAWEPKLNADEIGYNDWAMTIFPGSKTSAQTIDWRFYYGELPSGKYKLKKYITHFREPGDSDKIYLEREFVLP